LLVNPLNSRSNIEFKLLKLYKEHGKISTKIIELFKYISDAISEDDGYKLEKYSLIEKDFINQLVNIKQVIKGFEKICSVTSSDLDLSRSKAVEQEEIILVMGKKNRNTIKSSLEKISAQIEIFSRKIIYSTSFLRQTTPVFIDLSV
jgi:hypothetical protein